MFNHILEIVEGSNKFMRIYASNGQRINFTLNNKPHVYFLTEGRVDIYRKADDILIFTVYAPYILGIIFMFEKDDYITFELQRMQLSQQFQLWNWIVWLIVITCGNIFS